MLLLELKRIIKTRSTWLLAIGAIVVSLLLSLVTVTGEVHWDIDENVNDLKLSGMDAIEANQTRVADIEGELTPDKIRDAFEIYQEVYDTYGNSMSDVPKDIFYSKIAPIHYILDAVQEVFVDGETGIPLPLNEISSEQAAMFYSERDNRLADYLQKRYVNSPDIEKYAIYENQKIRTPLYYEYGIGDSNISEYLTICIFLLILISCAIVAPVFSGDYQSGADSILRCTKNGRKKLAIVKILSALIITGTIFVLSITAFVLITYSAFGWRGLDTSFQLAFSVISFAPLTVGGTNILIIVTGLLSFVASVSFTVFLSAKLKSPVATLGTALGVALLPTILFFIGDGGKIAYWVRLLLPTGGVGLRNSFLFELTEFVFLKVGTVNIWTPYIIPVVALVETLVFLPLSVSSYLKYEKS